MIAKQLLLASLAVTSFAQGPPSLTAALSGNPNLSLLNTVIAGFPDLVSTLSGLQNITILAPNNAALGALNSSSALTSDPGAIAALLTYHVLNGTYRSSQITNTSAFVPTLLTNATYANVTGGQRIQALKKGGNVTVVSGLLNNSTVVTADQNFTGGTIHIINKLLTLPANISTTLVAANLTSLYGALRNTSLASTVSGLKDVTIFAPNNQAFRNIGSAVGNLSTSQLSSILTYHVVNGTAPIYSSDIKNGTSLTSLNGGKLTIRASNGTVFVNGAKVITTDVLVAGGVVHVIDNVLNPGNATATAPSGAASGAVAFSGASSASTVPFTSGVATPTGTLGAGAGTSTAGTARSSSTSGVAMPAKTGAIGVAALFGAGAVLANF